jgi:hypothetical protein
MIQLRTYLFPNAHLSGHQGRRLVFCILSVVAMLSMAWSDAAPLHAQPSQESLNATGRRIVETIKEMCRQRHPDNEQGFRKCAVKRYDAMKGFFAKLYHYRDTKGTRSDEFKKGIACLDNASPRVQEPGREVAVERADWVKANECYEAALR